MKRTMNHGTAPLYIFIAGSKLPWHQGFVSHLSSLKNNQCIYDGNPDAILLRAWLWYVATTHVNRTAFKPVYETQKTEELSRQEAFVKCAEKGRQLTHRALGSCVINLFMMKPMYTKQPPKGVKASQHCPIDVPFFPPVWLLSEVNLKQHAVEHLGVVGFE